MSAITGLILAGGRGSRMGEVDKGLQPFQGQPMVTHVITRLQPQCNALIINANRNADTYALFGHIVVADGIEGFAGRSRDYMQACPTRRRRLLSLAHAIRHSCLLIWWRACKKA